MGTWSERYLKNKTASLGKSTAKNCQNSESKSTEKDLSAIGSGFHTESENIFHSTERKDFQNSLTGITAKTAKTQQQSLKDFMRLVQHYGADHGVLLDEPVICRELDPDGIRELQSTTRPVRQSWATAIALRLVRERGIVPVGWDQVADCARCGPVWSWLGGHTETCPWCCIENRAFLRPQEDI